MRIYTDDDNNTIGMIANRCFIGDKERREFNRYLTGKFYGKRGVAERGNLEVNSHIERNASARDNHKIISKTRQLLEEFRTEMYTVHEWTNTGALPLIEEWTVNKEYKGWCGNWVEPAEPAVIYWSIETIIFEDLTPEQARSIKAGDTIKIEMEPIVDHEDGELVGECEEYEFMVQEVLSQDDESVAIRIFEGCEIESYGATPPQSFAGRE